MSIPQPPNYTKILENNRKIISNQIQEKNTETKTPKINKFFHSARIQLTVLYSL